MGGAINEYDVIVVGGGTAGCVVAGRLSEDPALSVLLVEAGGSAINGMMFIRGHRDDFDRWSDLGCAGWDYASVLLYFRHMESTGAARMNGAAARALTPWRI